MKNKLLKTLTCFAGISAIGSTTAIATTSCGCSSQNDRNPLEFNSLSEFANYNFNSWENDLGIKCGKHYTNNNSYTEKNHPEYISNITADLKQKNMFLQNFLCESFIGTAERSITCTIGDNGSSLTSYDRDGVYSLFTENPNVNDFSLKFNYPKNIKWSNKSKDGKEYDVVSFDGLSFTYRLEFFYNDSLQTYEIDYSFDNINLYFSRFCFESGIERWKTDSLMCFRFDSFDGSNCIHVHSISDRGEETYTQSGIDLYTVYFPNSNKIFSESTNSLFVKY